MAANLRRQAPVLLVRDIPKSVAYWVERVGFATEGIWGEPPDFAILIRDHTNLMLSRAPANHEIVPFWRIKDKLWNAYFWVDDARKLFDELKGRGATIDYGLCDQPYGVLEFGIRDLDDQDIGFGQILTGDDN
jgi:hypothetical protein